MVGLKGIVTVRIQKKLNMVGSKKQNGFTKFENEWFDELLKFPLPGRAWRVLLFIIRKTYGWGKKQDRISLSQFELGTGIPRNQVPKEIKKLKDCNLIGSHQEGNRKPVSYWFKKDYESWKPPRKTTVTLQVVTKKDATVSQKGYKTVSQEGNNKRKKETIQKKEVDKNQPEEKEKHPWSPNEPSF